MNKSGENTETEESSETSKTSKLLLKLSNQTERPGYDKWVNF